MIRCLLLLLLIITTSADAQFTLKGKVTDKKLEPLAFATIQVKELPGATLTKEDGSFRLKLEEGSYEIVFSMVGYKTQKIVITMTTDYVQNIIMEEDEGKVLQNIEVKGRSKDHAEEIIKELSK